MPLGPAYVLHRWFCPHAMFAELAWATLPCQIWPVIGCLGAGHAGQKHSWRHAIVHVELVGTLAQRAVAVGVN